MYDFSMVLLNNLWDLPSTVFVGVSLVAVGLTCSSKDIGLMLVARGSNGTGILTLVLPVLFGIVALIGLIVSTTLYGY